MTINSLSYSKTAKALAAKQGPYTACLDLGLSTITKLLRDLSEPCQFLPTGSDQHRLSRIGLEPKAWGEMHVWPVVNTREYSHVKDETSSENLHNKLLTRALKHAAI